MMPGSEAERARLCGNESEGYGGVEKGVVRSGWRGRGLRVGQHDVLSGPDRLEAGSLGREGYLQSHLGLRAYPYVDAIQSELHLAAPKPGRIFVAIRSMALSKSRRSA